VPIGGNQILRYFQIREEGEERPYSFSADYVLVESPDTAADLETNARINSFISNQLKGVRARGMQTAEDLKVTPDAFRSKLVDSSWISHRVSLFTDQVLSLEFFVGFYYAGAAHPNSFTRTFNFGLHPSMELDIKSIFDQSSNYLELLSKYCIDDLLRQKAQRGSESLKRPEQFNEHEDQWILKGAGPEYHNFEIISLQRNGVTLHFDPYQVDCRSAGKYEVFIPAYKLTSIIRVEVAKLLTWC
jgi:hypothetical protein